MALTHREAKTFYDRFGAKQDKQSFYEDPAIERLIENARLGSAGRILEFGCGTGRFAERILRKEAAPRATYLGLDISPVMVELAQSRLSPFGDRAKIQLTDGAIELRVPNASIDCVITTYVMDLLSDDDIHRFLEEARRVLRPGGHLGLVSITKGTGIVSRTVMAVLNTAFRIRPSLVGGCRPIALTTFLQPAEWKVFYRRIVTPFGIASEAVVAARKE